MSSESEARVREDRRQFAVVAGESEQQGRRGHADATALREAWNRAALATGWTRPGDWWAPEVDAVAEALAGGGDVPSAVARLGRARADAGVGVREALDDLCALYRELPPGSPPLSVVRPLVEAWTEASIATIRAATCEDPLSGLATGTYLRTRFAEVYREADHDGIPAGERRTLLVIEADSLARNSGWESLLLRLELGDCLRSVFSGGETLAAATPTTVIGLVGRDHWLVPKVGALRERLTEVSGLGAVRIWTEALPATLAAAFDVLETVGRPA